MLDQAPNQQALVDHVNAMVDQLPKLQTAVSVPPFLEVPGPCNLLLSSSETRSCLNNFCRINSAPPAGDELKPTMCITALELNGTAHELGWFPAETSVGEIKRRTSENMCVPTRAISLASCDSIPSGSSCDSLLVDDSSPLGEVWPRFGPGANLNVVVQFPASFEETLKRVDDIRVHEDVYEELVNFACQFQHKRLTLANVSVLLRVVQLICESLHAAKHSACRGWAIKALSRLLEHSMKQLRNCHDTTADASPQAAAAEKLENAVRMIVEGLQPVSQSGSWLEQNEARAALAKLDSWGLSKLNPALYRRLAEANVQAHARLGGA